MVDGRRRGRGGIGGCLGTAARRWAPRQRPHAGLHPGHRRAPGRGGFGRCPEGARGSGWLSHHRRRCRRPRSDRGRRRHGRDRGGRGLRREDPLRRGRRAIRTSEGGHTGPGHSASGPPGGARRRPATALWRRRDGPTRRRRRGGLAGGLAALGARLVPGFDLVADTVGLVERVSACRSGDHRRRSPRRVLVVREGGGGRGRARPDGPGCRCSWWPAPWARAGSKASPGPARRGRDPGWRSGASPTSSERRGPRAIPVAPCTTSWLPSWTSSEGGRGELEARGMRRHHLSVRRSAALKTSVAWGRSSLRGRLRWMRTPRSTWAT